MIYIKNDFIEENITKKSEFYTSGAIKEMINDGVSFKNINIFFMWIDAYWYYI